MHDNKQIPIIITRFAYLCIKIIENFKKKFTQMYSRQNKYKIAADKSMNRKITFYNNK